MHAKALHNGKDPLPLSLFSPYKDLPPDGKTRSEKDESCNPEERSCQTPIHTWESKCKACQGTGSVRSSGGRRGRHSSFTCISCHGIGFVRRVSSRIQPDLNGGDGPDFTLARPSAAAVDDDRK
ncbi:hypothetical protein WJX72_006761 [[Myrmecia] bisecta]|uniref:Uncharacterized protein n=1 Tax=[Myrmecia] bisecta TaxID=41462 RepID=A0AAW1P1W4_9CHLO